MPDLSILFEELLNENPNQAIKFLKDKNLNPQENPKGKQILDTILDITRGDGYTYLLTKLFVNERKPIEEIRELYLYIKENKQYLTRLPKPVVNYETYRELRNDMDRLHGERISKNLYNQLSIGLKQQIGKLSVPERFIFKETAKKFEILPIEKQKHFLKKVFGYDDIHVFLQNINNYIREVQAGHDYESTKQKIETTENANIAYDNPEQDILIAHIDSFAASKTLGCTSAWCITRDSARFRQYKTGGNFYFFIWDYNYPIDNSQFFIATAYNINNPNASQTHEHLDDNQIRLDEVIKQKQLSYDIFNNYIEEYKKKQSESLASSEGLIKALNERDTDAIIELLQNSATIQEYKKSEPYTNWRKDTIEMEINKAGMIQMLELGEEYNTIESISHYSYSNDYYDSDEANYMYGGLSDENIALLSELAKILGVSSNIYEDFKNKEGAIKNFLEKYDMEALIQTYISGYGEAQSESEKRSAQELLDEIPFNVSQGSFEINKMLDYYIKHNLTADNFDDLIEQIKSKLPSYSYESISESRYTDLDLDELNRDFKNELENIINEIENNEDNEHYTYAKMLRDSTEYLQKIGFKLLSPSEENLAILTAKNGTIIIHYVEHEDEDDTTSQIMVNAELKAKGSTKSTRIKVPLKSIQNYIDQYEIPNYLNEQLKRIKSIINSF